MLLGGSHLIVRLLGNLLSSTRLAGASGREQNDMVKLTGRIVYGELFRSVNSKLMLYKIKLL